MVYGPPAWADRAVPLIIDTDRIFCPADVNVSGIEQIGFKKRD
jgi:hypothetical protein